MTAVFFLNQESSEEPSNPNDPWSFRTSAFAETTDEKDQEYGTENPFAILVAELVEKHQKEHQEKDGCRSCQIDVNLIDQWDETCRFFFCLLASILFCFLMML